MTFRSTSAALGLAIAVMAGSVFGALAEDDGQQPPADPPAAEQAPPEKPKCVTSNTAWKEDGKSPAFEIELVNSCDMKLRCTIDAFVIGSRGQTQGHGTVVLAAAPKGQTTRAAYLMKVKSAGGMANISHSCKSI